METTQFMTDILEAIGQSNANTGLEAQLQQWLPPKPDPTQTAIATALQEAGIIGVDGKPAVKPKGKKRIPEVGLDEFGKYQALRMEV